jgi:hypothetical protein
MSALEIRSVEIVPPQHEPGAMPMPATDEKRSKRGARTDQGTRPAPVVVRLDELERDATVNCRAGGVSERITAEYVEAMQAGAKFPPVVVFRDADGKLWLADGFHRCRAAELAADDSVRADVREGDRRAALLYAAGANASHGARRTNADKRRAVAALFADPEWAGWSDQIVAERCAVSQPFVSSLRRSTQNGSGLGARRGKDGKVRRAPKRTSGPKFRRLPSDYRAACHALKELSTAWAKRKPIAAHLAEARRALDALEQQQTEA